VLAIGLWSVLYGVVQIALAFEVKSLSARADTVDRRINAVSGSRSVGAAAGREGVP